LEIRVLRHHWLIGAQHNRLWLGQLDIPNMVDGYEKNPENMIVQNGRLWLNFAGSGILCGTRICDTHFKQKKGGILKKDWTK